ncbi:MAG TPA: thioredoxin family protein [Anaerolineales bacterium]|nr:thioredoxin family protein [Anaerolineales bacterium]
MDKQFFQKGETIEQFLGRFAPEAKAKFEQHLQENEFEASQLQEIEKLPDEVNVVVIAEPWSGDVLYNMPTLIRFAQAASWRVRIFPRDSYPDLILPYRKDGLYHSIPVFVFYDKDFNELGHWIERPAIATQVIDDESLKLRRRLREENKESWRKATQAELMDLLKPLE